MLEALKMFGLVFTATSTAVAIMAFLLKNTFLEYIKTALNERSEIRIHKANELHNKKLEFIFEIFRDLTDIHTKLKEEVAEIPYYSGYNEILDEIAPWYSEIMQFKGNFEAKKIILSKELSKEISDLLAQFLDLYARIYAYLGYIKNKEIGKDDIPIKEVEKLKESITEANNQKIPNTLKKIEDEFRKEVGS